MATIKTFKAIRPTPSKVQEVAALPYDVFNRREAKEYVKDRPYSFLNIDRPETAFADDYDMYRTEVYEAAANQLEQFIREGILIEEEKPCYYIYELVMNGRAQTGIVGCASLDDYLNNVIKKHENTREDKEQDRIRHVDTCSAQTGPIFLAYRKNDMISTLIAEKKKETPIYSFVAEDGIQHSVWVVSLEAEIQIIAEQFALMQDIYIADGHHRCASAVKVGLKRREANKNHTGNEQYNYFLSVLFADEELMILDYNRVVKDLNGHSKEEFIEKLKQNFQIEGPFTTPVSPARKGEFGMCIGQEWYRLRWMKEMPVLDPVKQLDVSILQEDCLEPLLGIHNPKVDKRIDFVGGIRGLEELQKRVNEDMKIAFSLYPTSIQELFQVADQHLLMPPKSTWFEPKLRSGLFIHKIER